ncbi:MAG: hypothetical protein MK135_11480, partial [Polyangiaceae bacterium]|nr:hypothetical protein [Polyangiaceae bacterium]
MSWRLPRNWKASAYFPGSVQWQWLSWLCLLGVVGAYLATWVNGNWPMLTDPQLQNDDARTALFPFHRYGAADALADDPIATEMLGFMPPGVFVLYRFLVPVVDIFVAAKIVQGVALSILLYAAWVLARSRRAGLAGGCVLLFLFAHDWFAINRVAGGLPRAFGFPLFALWLSGVIAQKRKVRAAAPLLAALTYPSVMLMILAAEGLFALRNSGRLPWSVVLRRLRRYALVVVACFVFVLPATLGGEERGRIHTLEEARKEPAFGRKGRLWILPFADPVRALGDAYVDAYRPRGSSPWPQLKTWAAQDKKMTAVTIAAILLLIPFFAWGRIPSYAWSFAVGAVILYWLSRTYAFRLYSPERYYSFGMRM